MKLQLIIPVLALGSGATADVLRFIKHCDIFRCYITSATYYTNDGAARDAKVDPYTACQGAPVPEMVEWCIDVPQRRGHFRYAWETNKRCLVELNRWDIACGGPGDSCWGYIYSEEPCYWKRNEIVGEEEVEDGSAGKVLTLEEFEQKVQDAVKADQQGKGGSKVVAKRRWARSI